jgi:hypothetical protein
MPASEPRFLNVDLDLESRDALGQLVDALPSLDVMVSARMRGRHVLSLELATPGLSLDQTVRRFAKEISALSGKPRRLWQRATKRCFNIGFECGDRRAPPFLIQRASVEAIAALGASLEITLYPRERQRRRSVTRRQSGRVKLDP